MRTALSSRGAVDAEERAGLLKLKQAYNLMEQKMTEKEAHTISIDLLAMIDGLPPPSHREHTLVWLSRMAADGCLSLPHRQAMISNRSSPSEDPRG